MAPLVQIFAILLAGFDCVDQSWWIPMFLRLAGVCSFPSLDWKFGGEVDESGLSRYAGIVANNIR